MANKLDTLPRKQHPCTRDVIAPYNKDLYAIITTLYKIITTSKINFEKNSPFRNFVKWIAILSHSVENFVKSITILSHSVKSFVRWKTIFSQSAENFVRYLRVHPIFEHPGCFLFKIIFCEYIEL